MISYVVVMGGTLAQIFFKIFHAYSIHFTFPQSFQNILIVEVQADLSLLSTHLL